MRGLDVFLSFFKKHKENKTHNMLSLMLDLRFKSLRLVPSLIGGEHVVSIVKKHDQ
jgi:hypothetical protein